MLYCGLFWCKAKKISSDSEAHTAEVKAISSITTIVY
jgi:hypothetical protein